MSLVALKPSIPGQDTSVQKTIKGLHMVCLWELLISYRVTKKGFKYTEIKGLKAIIEYHKGQFLSNVKYQFLKVSKK